MSWVGIGSAAVSVVGGALLSDSPNNDGANNAANTAAGIQGEQWQLYKNARFPELETSLVKDVENAGGADDQEVAASQAGADVANAYQGARQGLSMQRIAAGVGDPSTLASQSTNASLTGQEKTDQAGAQTLARRTAKLTGFAQKMDVNALGKGIVSNATAGLLGASDALNRSASLAYNQSFNNAQTAAKAIAPAATAGLGALKGWFDKSGSVDAGAAEPINTNGMADYYAQTSGSGKFGAKDGGLVRFAGGGAISGPGTSTSDSVPATIDGNQPAALSDGEHVVNAEGVKMVGRHVLDAINMLGLIKRYQNEQKSKAYASGGRVSDGRGTAIYNGPTKALKSRFGTGTVSDSQGNAVQVRDFSDKTPVTSTKPPARGLPEPTPLRLNSTPNSSIPPASRFADQRSDPRDPGIQVVPLPEQSLPGQPLYDRPGLPVPVPADSRWTLQNPPPDYIKVRGTPIINIGTYDWGNKARSFTYDEHGRVIGGVWDPDLGSDPEMAGEAGDAELIRPSDKKKNGGLVRRKK